MVSNNIRKTTQEKLWDIIIYTIVFFAALVTVWPFIYVLSMSVSSQTEVIKASIWFFPKGFSLKAYGELVENQHLWRAYANTIIYVISGTALDCIVSFLTAYSLVRQKNILKKFFTFYLIIPMYFTGGIVPLFILINKMGLYNNPLIMVIPFMVSIWNIILVRTYIKTIPESLFESAKIDGAKEYMILSKIVVPLSKPILAVIILYTAVNIWNNWFHALLFLPNKDWQPLQYFLARVLVYGSPDLVKNVAQANDMVERAGMNIQLKYAAIIFVSLPIICTYPFLQKYFVKGVLIGSLKE